MPKIERTVVKPKLERFDYTPLMKEDIALPHGGTLHLEHYADAENTIAAVVGHWGVEWSREQVEKQIRELYGDNSVAQGDTGFSTLWRPQEGLNFEQLSEQSIAVAGIQMAKTVIDNGWEPTSVKAVFIAGDAFPLEPNDLDGARLKQRYLEAAGLTHLDPKTQVSLKGLACNAGADELLDALNPSKHPELQGENVIIHAQSTLYDELAKYPDKSLKEIIDAFSLQVFSLGAVTFGIKPGETMSLILTPDGRPMAVVEEKYDKGQALAAKTPFKDFLPPIDPDSDELVQVKHEIAFNFVLGRMPPTRDLIRILDMDPRKTAGTFPRGTEKRVVKYVNGDQEVDKNGFAHDVKGFIDYYPNGTLDEKIEHHASLLIAKGIEARLLEEGIDIKVYWVNQDGNAPPANTLMALARRLKYLDNKNVLIVSFGGGVTYSIYALRLGPDGANPEVVGA